LFVSIVVRWLSRFAPVPLTIKWTERLRACVGALIGIALTARRMNISHSPLYAPRDIHHDATECTHHLLWRTFNETSRSRTD